MKPLMTQKTLENKLKRIKNQHVDKMMQYAREARKRARNDTDRHNWSAPYIKRAKAGLADALPLRFKKRSLYFENYKNSCGFDPITGDGHSYGWYALTKVIRGKLVLNTYNYSNQTAKHVGKVRRLLEILGLKYVSVEAPRGLQNLETCRNYTALEYGRAFVRQKYSRGGKSYALKYAKKTIQDARSIGLTFPKSLLARAISEAEKERAERNERARRRRAERLEQRALTLIQGRDSHE